AGQISGAVGVGVEESPGEHLVEDGVFVPVGISGTAGGHQWSDGGPGRRGQGTVFGVVAGSGRVFAHLLLSTKMFDVGSTGVFRYGPGCRRGRTGRLICRWW